MLLPKKNLSYSQISCWHKTKTHRDYIKRYFYNEKPYVIKEMLFGRYVSENLEKESLFDVAPDLLEVFSTLPLDGISEQAIVKQMRGFYTISYLDKGCPDYSFVREFKTGKKEWDQDRTDKHEQFDFYNWAIYKNFGHLPDNELVWMETANDAGSDIGICLTGRVERFERTAKIEDVEAIEEKIIKTAEEISKAYKMFLNGEDLATHFNWR